MSELESLLCQAAQVAIEDLDDADILRSALATADDIADRLREQLTAMGAWFGT